MDAAEMARYTGSYANPPPARGSAVRDGKLYFRRGAQEGEVTKVGDLRFSVAFGGGPTQSFALVPTRTARSRFLHMAPAR